MVKTGHWKLEGESVPMLTARTRFQQIVSLSDKAQSIRHTSSPNFYTKSAQVVFASTAHGTSMPHNRVLRSGSVGASPSAVHSSPQSHQVIEDCDFLDGQWLLAPAALERS